jgi:hypothetical protein
MKDTVHHRALRLLSIPVLAATGTAFVGAATPARGATSPVDWQLAVTVRPTVPDEHPTSEDRIRVVVSTFTHDNCGELVFETPTLTGKTIRLQGHREGQIITCIPNRSYQEFELPRLAARPSWDAYRLEVYDEELLIHEQPIEVFGPARQLSLADSSGNVSGYYHTIVSVRLTDPAAGPARDVGAVRLTERSGYFWFFDPDNVEVTAKIVDGRAVNGHTWLFLTGMSNLGFTVTVKPGGPGTYPVRTYVNPPGQRLNVIDTELP